MLSRKAVLDTIGKEIAKLDGMLYDHTRFIYGASYRQYLLGKMEALKEIREEINKLENE